MVMCIGENVFCVSTRPFWIGTKFEMLTGAKSDSPLRKE